MGVCHIPAKSLLLKIRGFRGKFITMVVLSLSRGADPGGVKIFFQTFRKKEVGLVPSSRTSFDTRKIVFLFSLSLSLSLFFLIYIPVASMNNLAGGS